MYGKKIAEHPLQVKVLMIIVTGLLLFKRSSAQADSANFNGWPNGEYMVYLYDPETKTVNPSYNYSNKWDLDCDGINDSFFFIGNGGAHVYFYPRIILSSDHKTRDYPFMQLDMPYFLGKEEMEKYGRHPAIQFVIDDLNKDGVLDIYLDFHDTLTPIPKSWRQRGIKTKFIVMSFPRGKLKVSDYSIQ
jgi:hypothetical protein